MRGTNVVAAHLHLQHEQGTCRHSTSEGFYAVEVEGKD